MSDTGVPTAEAEALATEAGVAATGDEAPVDFASTLGLPAPRSRSFSIGEVSREEAIEELVAAGVTREDIEAVEEQYNATAAPEGESKPELTGSLLIALVGNGLGGVPLITQTGLERIIRNVTYGTSADMKPRPKPTTDFGEAEYERANRYRGRDEAYREDINGFMRWFGEVFSGDRQVRRAMERLLTKNGMLQPGREGGFNVNAITPGNSRSLAQATQGKGDVARAYGESLFPEELIDQLMDEEGGLEPEIATTVLEAWRSGWSQLSPDHASWDPEGILTPVIEANDSPILDRDPSNPETTRRIVRNPITSFEAADIAAVWGDNVQSLLKNPTLREQVLAGAVGAASAFEGYVYSSSKKAAEILYSREVPADALLNVEGPGKGPLVYDEQKTIDPTTGEQVTVGPRSAITTLAPFIPANRFNLPYTMDVVIQAMAKAEAEKAHADKPNSTVMDATLMWDDGLSDQEVRDIQLAAFFAGQYPEGTEPDTIIWGDRMDETARSMWVSSVEQSALSAARGENMTPKQIIRKIKDRAKSAQQDALGDAIDTMASPIVDLSQYTVNLTDPASIVTAANDLAKSLLGRDATAAMKRQLVALVHDGESQAQMRDIRRQVAAEQRRLEEERNAMLEELASAEELLFKAEEEAAFAAGPGQVRADVGAMPGEHPNFAAGDVPYGVAARERLRSLGSPRPSALRDIEAAGGSAQSTVDGGVEGEVSVDQGFDADARMEMWLRNNYAEEIDAKSFREMLSLMPRMFSSPVSPTPLNPDEG